MRHKPRSDAGFTLVEVLAALAVFSVSALGLMQVATQNIVAAQRIETRALARLVAENQMVELLTSQVPLSGTAASGRSELAGRSWQWDRNFIETPNALVIEVRISVSQVTEASSQEAGSGGCRAVCLCGGPRLTCCAIRVLH